MSSACAWVSTSACLLLLATGASAQIVDGFDRPNAADLGNGWIEKNPQTFQIATNSVSKQAVGTGYRDNVVYRPAAENLIDVEASIEFRLTSASPGYPQILTRIQTGSVAASNSLTGYILYINNSTSQAILGRQTSTNFVTALATIALTPSLTTSDTYRLRLRSTGTNPVQLSANIERRDGTTWTVIGQAVTSDSSTARISTAGSVGFSGYVESSYSYDNFAAVDLSSGSTPVPTLSAVSPSAVTAGSSGFSLTVTGTNFVPGSLVRWNGADRATTFLSSSQLLAAVLDTDVAASGTATVTVFNPAPGGGTSQSISFSINAVVPDNPIPVLALINPASALMGSSSLQLTAIGSGFSPNSVVQWNGSARPTTFVSSTQLNAMISGTDLAQPGSAQVSVFTPIPGGGTSTTLQFVVEELPISNPLPVLISLDPSETTEGGGDLTVTLTGTDFMPATEVRWNGNSRPTTFVSSTQLRATIAASDISTAGSAEVTAFTQAPGGGSSAAQIFTVQPAVSSNPVPIVTSLNPNAATEGGSSFVLTVSGLNFLPNSVVRWNGSDRATTFVSPSVLSAAINAADIAAPGAASVAVFTPAPGGGLSGGQAFTIQPSAGAFLDAFDRPASADIGNGWIEKNPQAFALTVETARKQSVSNGYRDNVVYRPSSENTLDVEASVEFRLNASNPGYPQILTRLQTSTVAIPNVLDGYILYVNNSQSQAIMGRQAGSGFVTGLATINLAPAIDLVSTHRLRLRTTGTNPVSLAAFIERWDGSTWQVLGQATASDTGGSQITNPGSVGFSGYTESSYAFDNFSYANLSAGSNPTPNLASISPNSATEGGSAMVVTAIGSNFVPGSVVRWNGADRVTTYLSSTQLLVDVFADDIAVPGAASVSVFNPGPGGGTSAARSFTVNPASTSNPVPVLASMSPDTATEGGSAFSLTVFGSNFVPDSVVQWNGANRLTTYVSSTQLQAAVTSADISVNGSATVGVFTPGPGGGTSAGRTFTILDSGTATTPAPVVSGLSAVSAVVGNNTFTLSVLGTGFTQNTVSSWNGQARATQFVSDQQVDMTVSSGDLSIAGVNSVAVSTPAPGGGDSAPYPFFVLNTGSSFFLDDFNSPDSLNIGNGWTEKNPNAFSLVDNSIVGVETSLNVYRDNIVYRPSGEDRSDVEVGIEFVRIDDIGFPQIHARAQRDTITIPDLLESYIFYIEDNRPPTGAAAFAIGPNLVSTGECHIAEMPLSAPLQIGERYRLRLRVIGQDPVELTGTLERYSSGSWQVEFSGTVFHDAMTPPDPSYCDPEFMPPQLITAGTTGFSKWIDAPDNYDNFYWIDLASDAGMPAITSVSPTQIEVNSPPFELLVQGRNFTMNSVVLWNGQARTTLFISPTALQATIPATDLVTAGTNAIAVATPPPGGGTSSPFAFEVIPENTQINPVPSITALSPSAVTAGSADTQLTVTGAGFVPGTVVRWNGSNRQTTFVSDTTLIATVTSADVAIRGTAAVSVLSPGPGGGSSATISIPILAVGEFYDNFDRNNGSEIGNGWTEKNAAAFNIAAGRLVKNSVGSGYRDNLVYRPISDARGNVEASVEFVLASALPGYPQLLTRVQPATVASPNSLDAYILYVSNSPGQAILGRQTGGSFVSPLATLSLTEPLAIGPTYRMRLAADGTSPVALTAYIERLTPSGFTVIGQASATDTSFDRIVLPGMSAVSGYVEAAYSYDNFRDRTW
ncbi:MAG: hypothetical protein OEV58_07830 [Gammaproteobacteria bacterium]|nr:hypothetical protein [Gammaproteobacteria bacterium]MDH5261577.1 hypothetical protein [Gammaproteobacteria bacterium]